MVEIPKKQKAVVFDQPGTVSTKVVEIDVPEPGAGEVLINLSVYHSFTTSCLSGINSVAGHTPAYVILTMVS
jgi:D-arabinose 1-dehydrogenase-like Zn-dependent alcohol dehydrogenase